MQFLINKARFIQDSTLRNK